MHKITQFFFFNHVPSQPKKIIKPLHKKSMQPLRKKILQPLHKKSRIQDTKHLSTDADSSTDAIGGWTKNTQKPIFFEKRKKIIKNAKTQKRLEI